MEADKPHYNFARDGFVYLLSYATLLISSLGLNFLVKALVDRQLPDAAAGAFSFGSDDMAIIGFSAAVLIAFPIFTGLNVWANKMLGAGKMRHNTGVRNWLLYLTLVVVILVILWQLIALFVSFLSGVLASRFLIHTLITLAIAAVILVYQWWHLRFFDGKDKVLPKWFKIFEWTIFVVVVGMLVWGFASIDNPTVQRGKRLDQDRVNRLSVLHDQVQNFYGWSKDIGHGRLPASLDELINDPRVYIGEDGLIDPQTRQRFEYKPTGAKTYQLCATFDTEMTAETVKGKTRALVTEPDSMTQRFYHPKGYKCFDLAITEDGK